MQGLPRLGDMADDLPESSDVSMMIAMLFETAHYRLMFNLFTRQIDSIYTVMHVIYHEIIKNDTTLNNNHVCQWVHSDQMLITK